MAPTKLPDVRPELTVLPAQVLDNGFIERSYPGAANITGWTIFLRTSSAYKYQDFAPLFSSEQKAKRYLLEKYGVKIDLTINTAASGSEL
jgi:hypothetical protein